MRKTVSVNSEDVEFVESNMLSLSKILRKAIGELRDNEK